MFLSIVNYQIYDLICFVYSSNKTGNNQMMKRSNNLSVFLGLITFIFIGISFLGCNSENHD